MPAASLALSGICLRLALLPAALPTRVLKLPRRLLLPVPPPLRMVLELDPSPDRSSMGMPAGRGAGGKAAAVDRAEAATVLALLGSMLASASSAWMGIGGTPGCATPVVGVGVLTVCKLDAANGPPAAITEPKEMRLPWEAGAAVAGSPEDATQDRRDGECRARQGVRCAGT